MHPAFKAYNQVIFNCFVIMWVRQTKPTALIWEL